MADIVIPPWLHPQGDPVATFLHAFQTGAQISEAQSRLAEQQRQADMEAQARSEQLQATMLRAMTETAVQKEYQQQQIALRQQDLAQEKARYDALGEQAAASLAERIAHDQALEQLQQSRLDLPSSKLEAQQTFADEYQKNIESGMNAAEAYQKALIKSPALITPTTAPALSGKDTEAQRMRDFIARQEITGKQREAKTAEVKAGEEGIAESERIKRQTAADAAKAAYGALVAPWTNAPAVRPPGPQAKPDTEALRAEARAAIQRGKDPDAVRKRFKEMTGEEL